MKRKGHSVPDSWLTRAPRLSQIAAWINQRTTLIAEIRQGYCNTDRIIPNTRIRIPGKGRRGNELLVFLNAEHRNECWSIPRSAAPILRHNAAETYRCNAEVVRWLDDYLQNHPEAKKGTP